MRVRFNADLPEAWETAARVDFVDDNSDVTMLTLTTPWPDRRNRRCFTAGDAVRGICKKKTAGQRSSPAYLCLVKLLGEHFEADSILQQERSVMSGSLLACPVPEVARLRRTLRSSRSEWLAYFDTAGASNGPTEAMNLLIDKIRA